VRALAAPTAVRAWRGKTRHEIFAAASQTGAPSPDIVTAEGGGTNTPTLGGGNGVARAREPLTTSPAAVGVHS
jgi:hypothetical protein